MTQTRKLWALSPSAIDLHNDCARKWHYTYIGGFRRPDTQATTIGNQVHAQIDAYLRDGQNTLGPLALRLQPYLHPEIPHTSELALSFTADGIAFKGRTDLLLRGRTIDDEGAVLEAPDALEITDHKTGKRAYAQAPHDLATNLQGVFYLYGAAQAHTDAARFYFAHNFTATDANYAHRRRVLVADSRKELQEKFHVRVLTAAHRVRATFAIPDVNAVDANTTACDKYGGCHLKPICKAYSRHVMAQTLGAAFEAEKEDQQVSVLEDLLNEPVTQEQQLQDALRSLSEGRYPKRASEIICDLWDKYQGYPAVSGNLAVEYGFEVGQQAETFPGEGQFAHITVYDRDELIRMLPADYYGDVPTVEQAQAVVDARAAAAPTPVEPAPTPVEPAPTPVAPAPHAPVAEAPKRGRGRPKKTETAAPTEPPHNDPLLAPARFTPSPAPSTPVAAPVTWLGTAYIDCVVEGSDVIDLGPLAQRVIAACNAAFAVEDLRVKDDDALAYGRWRAIIQTSFVHTVQNEIPQGSHVRLHAKYSATLGPCVDALRGLAAVKVFGV